MLRRKILFLIAIVLSSLCQKLFAQSGVQADTETRILKSILTFSKNNVDSSFRLAARADFYYDSGRLSILKYSCCLPECTVLRETKIFYDRFSRFILLKSTTWPATDYPESYLFHYNTYGTLTRIDVLVDDAFGPRMVFKQLRKKRGRKIEILTVAGLRWVKRTTYRFDRANNLLGFKVYKANGDISYQVDYSPGTFTDPFRAIGLFLPEVGLENDTYISYKKTSYSTSPPATSEVFFDFKFSKTGVLEEKVFSLELGHAVKVVYEYY